MSIATQQTITPFQALQARKLLAKKIDELEKADKQLKAIVESAFTRKSQKTYTEGDLSIVRQLKVVQPFHNPGYQYYVYSLAST